MADKSSIRLYLEKMQEACDKQLPISIDGQVASLDSAKAVISYLMRRIIRFENNKLIAKILQVEIAMKNVSGVLLYDEEELVSSIKELHCQIMSCLQAEKSLPITNQKSKPNLRQAKNPTVKVVELQKPFGFELTKTKFSKRFKITGMTEDGEAAKSGMKCGDNVVGLWFNGTNMTNFKWNKIVAAFHSAQSCKLELKQIV